MKTLIRTVMLLTAVATSPALAQAPHSFKQNTNVQASDVVYSTTGQYRGQDPDANVRFELRRETPPSGE